MLGGSDVRGRCEGTEGRIAALCVTGWACAACTMFTASKDALASRAAQTWANTLIARYGKIQDVKIDSRLKTVEVTCLLHGEPSPITVEVVNYVVDSEAGKKFVRATGFRCTRPWLQNVLTDFGHGKRVELPRWAAAAL